MRGFVVAVVAVTVLTATVLAVNAASDNPTKPPSTASVVTLVPMTSAPTVAPSPQTGTQYSADALAQASAMTQQMSVVGPPMNGHEYHVHGGDQQLQLSQSDPEFVRELEAYQAQIDRMLARNQ